MFTDPSERALQQKMANGYCTDWKVNTSNSRESDKTNVAAWISAKWNSINNSSQVTKVKKSN